MFAEQDLTFAVNFEDWKAGRVLSDFEFSMKFRSQRLSSLTIDVTVTLPRLYPDVAPRIRVESKSFSNKQLDTVAKHLQRVVDAESGNESLMLVVQSAQEILDQISEDSSDHHATSPATSTHIVQSVPVPTLLESQRITFLREFILSHHIYNKTKRENILDWAKESKLGGVSFPGKPGVIIVEGEKKSVLEYSARVKSMNWQRIRTQLTEEKLCEDFEEFQKLCVFGEKFEEKHFVNHNNHLDSAQVLATLTSVGLSDRFHSLFGMSG
eukprot:c10316_g1_i1.p1 GENE.c10316_g1_i1~~c10316_g1_i1.p1  ORF type:complete len:268 (-),score=76.07 c10316_g1_i1:20-823(-)